jgi:hypothetical protein
MHFPNVNWINCIKLVWKLHYTFGAKKISLDATEHRIELINKKNNIDDYGEIDHLNKIAINNPISETQIIANTLIRRSITS